MTSSLFQFEPIGTVHSPFLEKKDAPRQAITAKQAKGHIELFQGRGFEFALEDLEAWERIWVLFVFDRSIHYKPKVLPPRSTEKRGVFSTRSPHRPNPIGLSCVKLEGVERNPKRCILHISELDILNGTPVLDIKPYVPYADAFPQSRYGWIQEEAESSSAPLPSSLEASLRDPKEEWTLHFSASFSSALKWLHAEGILLEPALRTALALGPEPHPYRRIKVLKHLSRRDFPYMQLAHKEWRVHFTFQKDTRVITLLHLHSGYTKEAIERQEAPPLHLAFLAWQESTLRGL